MTGIAPLLLLAFCSTLGPVPSAAATVEPAPEPAPAPEAVGPDATATPMPMPMPAAVPRVWAPSARFSRQVITLGRTRDLTTRSVWRGTIVAGVFWAGLAVAGLAGVWTWRREARNHVPAPPVGW